MIGDCTSTTLKGYSSSHVKLITEGRMEIEIFETRHSIHLKMIKDFQLLTLSSFLKAIMVPYG